MKDFQQFTDKKLPLKKNPKKSQKRYSNLLATVKKVVVFMPPIILLLVVVFLILATSSLNEYNATNNIQKSPITSYKASSYPIYKSENTTIFSPTYDSLSSLLTSEGAIVMDADSKVVLFSKNPTTVLSMASTTKIMTALVSLSYFNLHDELIVKSGDVGGTVVGLYSGEKITFQNLLYAMLLPSGNDAAAAIADNYPGGASMFVAKMNEKAQELHLMSTHFSDPTGLDDRGDYSSVLDLANLAAYALKNPTFASIVATKERIVADASGKIYPLENINRLLGTNGINGVKTGFTPDAEGILVTSKVEAGHTLIIVVMKSQDRFKDTEVILNVFSGNITYVPMSP